MLRRFGRWGEARLIRDPLAAELRERGWEVEIEYPLPGLLRCDIWARRWPEERLIECKLHNETAGVVQVLNYAVQHRGDVIPTLAVPPGEIVTLLRGVCNRAGIDLWVQGEDWARPPEVQEARGETEIRQRFLALGDLVETNGDLLDCELQRRCWDKWEELVAAFRAICGFDPVPRLRVGNSGLLECEWPRGWR